MVPAEFAVAKRPGIAEKLSNGLIGAYVVVGREERAKVSYRLLTRSERRPVATSTDDQPMLPV
jgi:hypothetical protein